MCAAPFFAVKTISQVRVLADFCSYKIHIHAIHGNKHRRDWIAERIEWLVNTFAIEVASYAIMSNHYHIVLRVDVDKANSWTEAEVIRRWQRIYKGAPVVEQYLKNPGAAGIAEIAQDIIQTWRERLTDISWFMRCLNEYLAHKANAEDECKGRFWGWFLRPAKPAYITSM